MALQKWQKPKISKEDIEAGVKSSSNWTDLARRLLGKDNDGVVRTLKRYVDYYQIDTSHFSTISSRNNPGYKFQPTEMFVENSPSSNTVLAKVYRRLYPPEKCSECGIGTTWNNKPLTLHIDHKNGHGTDWRLENCRYLCPNCHYQTDTHGTKRGVRKRSKELKATPCELSDSFDELGCYKQVGLIYGMSDRSVKNAIRKYKKNITP